MNHAADGRDARTGSDKDRVLARLAQCEKSMRPVELDGRPFRQIAKPVGEEAFLHAVEAEIEGCVRPRRRRDGIGACVFLAIGPGMLDRDKLSRNKAELLHALDAKLDVLGLRRQQDGAVHASREHLPLDRSAVLDLGFHSRPLCRCG